MRDFLSRFLKDKDTILKSAGVIGFFMWNLLEGAVFENQYPKGMVALYPYAGWRFLIPILLILGGSWCHSVGIMLAFFIFFYVMDMEVTLEKWVPDKQ
jgi:hypothetical protein